MPNYFYNPCSPCCAPACGWGPYSWTKTSDIANDGLTQSDFSGTPAWAVNGGHLTMSGGTGSLWKQSLSPDPTGSLPAGHGWISGSLIIHSTVYQHPSSQTNGVFLGGLCSFYADWSNGVYTQALCDQFGNLNGGGSVLDIPGPKSGDTIAICAVQIGNVTQQNFQGSRFQVAFYVNGSNVSTIFVAGPPGTNPAVLVAQSASQNAGMVGQTAGQWGATYVICSDVCQTKENQPPPTGCPCNPAPTAWSVSFQGIGAGQWQQFLQPPNPCVQTTPCLDFNGTFELPFYPPLSGNGVCSWVLFFEASGFWHIIALRIDGINAVLSVGIYYDGQVPPGGAVAAACHGWKNNALSYPNGQCPQSAVLSSYGNATQCAGVDWCSTCPQSVTITAIP